MKKVMRFRWPIVILWIALAVVLTLTAPNMADLVRENGELKLPDGYPSSVATEMQKEHDPDNKGEQYIAVYNADHKLTTKDMDAIEKSLASIEKDKEDLHVTEVLDGFNQPELKDKFISKDGKTVIAALTVDAGDTPVDDIRNDLDKKMQIKGVDSYLTGNALINEDVIQGSEDGLHKTEGITVVFILVVLFLVFRSAIAPFIPLLTVGISYIIAQDIVAFLVNNLGFPVSTYTQIFMVVIMFGIGTDYCILLMSRFKEEVGRGLDIREAVSVTYRTAGKTVIYSGIAVLVAFTTLYFVQFDLYRSAVAVGVGIVVLLLAIYSVVPFFMSILGRHLFWPMSKSIEHKENKLWGFAGNLSFARPFVALLIVAIVIIPPIVLHTGEESFNSLDEISDKYPSKKGFEIVSDSFGAGQVAPTQIYLENDEDMRTSEYIALIEQVSDDLANLKSVDMVMSASRPVGTRVDDIYVKKQADALGAGMGEAGDGISQVKDGLDEAGQQLEAAEPMLGEAVSGVDALQSGTDQTKQGVSALQQGLTQISDGIKSGASGAGELKAGVTTARSELQKLQDGEAQLQSGYVTVQQNLESIANSLDAFSNQETPAIDTSAFENTIAQIENSVNAFVAAHPEMQQDPAFQKLAGDLQKLQTAGSDLKTQLETQVGQQMQAAKTQIDQLNTGISSLSSAMKQLNDQSSQISSGLSQFNDALGQLETGLDQLETGLNQAADGQDQAISQMPQIELALDQIAAGQGELASGFESFSGQIGQLTTGLKSGADGLGQVESGLGTATDLIDAWSKQPYSDSGIYVPDELLQNEDYQKVLDQYISDDGKMTTINVVLKANPYSNEAMNAIDDINDQLDASLKGTKLENANIGIGGMTSMNYDTRDMSTADYHLVVVFVLVSVFITLVILLRSLVMPIYLIASLMLTYLAALGYAEIIFTRIGDYSGLTWATPFFGFVVLIALGIDYSIFLMSRFNEYVGMSVKERMLLSMKKMGGVIFSAVIILGGTFAAMMPAGVLSLLEIATVVLIGLVLYAFIILPLFVPVMVKLFGRGNWWPFVTRKGDYQQDITHGKKEDQ
ncbi:MMPL family transporter [Listeria costaricensis]|uniref:MMPL family transporter n=1 Tax=Listeria costaricensis TaxID=2026604 RepID=UPI000C06E5BE|nr:MMPL family transporter [Listeria costaricensis]